MELPSLNSIISTCLEGSPMMSIIICLSSILNQKQWIEINENQDYEYSIHHNGMF